MNKIKIEVKLEASKVSHNGSFSPVDFGLTDIEWVALSEEEKNGIVQEWADGLDNLFWRVESFKENDKQ